jgi:hypothetical protein
MTGGFVDDLRGATNVLLRAPSMGGTRDVCTSLLTDDLEGPPNVLWVTFTRSPDACLEQWDAAGQDAATLGVIAVGESGVSLDRDDVDVETVGTASDLTGVGIAIGQFISDADGPTVVCFDSLTAMLQYVDLETAYEFLHTITGQLYTAGARAHFHMDPEAHQDDVVDAITSLLDASVDLSSEDPIVRTRSLLS